MRAFVCIRSFFFIVSILNGQRKVLLVFFILRKYKMMNAGSIEIVRFDCDCEYVCVLNMAFFSSLTIWSIYGRISIFLLCFVWAIHFAYDPEINGTCMRLMKKAHTQREAQKHLQRKSKAHNLRIKSTTTSIIILVNLPLLLNNNSLQWCQN